MKNYLKFLIFTLCLSGGFFGVGKLIKAQATCSFGGGLKIISNKYSVPYSDAAVLTASMTASGSDCGNYVNFQFTLITKAVPSGDNLGLVQASLQNNTATANFTVSPRNFVLNNLPDSSKLQLKVNVLNDQGKQVAQSSVLEISITDTPGYNLNLPLKISLSNSASIFNKDDKTDIQATLNDLVPLQQQQISSVYMAVYINNTSNPVGGKNLGVSSNLFVFPSLTVASVNGFKNGANNITVKLFKSGTSNQIGQGSAVIQAQGLSASAESPACTGTGKSTCAEGQACVNNKCQADAGAGAGGAGGGGGGSGGGGMQTQPAQTLYNPIKDASNLTELLLKIMRGFIMITGIWAVAFIVIGGFKMVISQGNEEAVTAAKKSIMWSVLGLIVVLLSFSIIAIIQNIIGIDVQDVKTSQNQIYQQTQKL